MRLAIPILLLVGSIGCGGGQTTASTPPTPSARPDLPDPVFDRVLVSEGRAFVLVAEMNATGREAEASIFYEAAEAGPELEIGTLPDAPPQARWTLAVPGCTATASGSRWLRIVTGLPDEPAETYRAVELEGCEWIDLPGDYFAVRDDATARWWPAERTHTDEAPEHGPPLRVEGTLGPDATFVTTFTSGVEEEDGVCPRLPASIEVRGGTATSTLALESVETWLRGAFDVGGRRYVVVHECAGHTRLLEVGAGEPRVVRAHQSLGEEFCEC